MFAIPKTELSPALALIRAGISKVSDVPVHSHILMQLKDNKLRLVTDCTTLHAETTLSAEGNDVALAVPGEIVDIVDRLNGIITFEPKASELTIKSGRTRVRLPVKEADCFSELEKDSDTNYCEVSASDLIRCFTLVDPAVARKHVQQHLTGVSLEWDNGPLTIVGTDGYMLSVSLIATNATWTGKCVVPLKTILEVVRLMKSTGVKLIGVSKGLNTITFTIGKCNITSKLLNGAFPDWRRICDGLTKVDPDATIQVPRMAIGDAMERIMLVAREEKKLLLQYDDGKLKLSIKDVKSGQSAEEPLQVDCESKGDMFLNKDQFTSTIARLIGDTVTIHIWDKNKPVRLSGKSRAEFYLITPMRE